MDRSRWAGDTRRVELQLACQKRRTKTRIRTRTRTRTRERARRRTAGDESSYCGDQNKMAGAVEASQLLPVIGGRLGPKTRSCTEWRNGTVITRTKPLDKRAVSTFILLALMAASLELPAKALQITQFRVPSFVPTNLATMRESGAMDSTAGRHHHHQLAKPILFDCDYDYRPEEDERLTVKWFKNKEAEPFYQWLPELNVRHFADWIKPLLNQSFVSDPHDPLKRYRSLLIRRLSLNLTGQYTCLVSSLAGQDMRQASLVVYQPPRSLTFEHRIYPAPAALLSSQATPTRLPPPPPLPLSQSSTNLHGVTNHRTTPGYNGTLDAQLMRPPPAGHLAASPTQFKGLPAASQPAASIIRPANNQQQQQQQNFTSLLQFGAQTAPPVSPAPTEASGRIVYTHDGRPIRRKTRHSSDLNDAGGIADWQLRKRLGADWHTQQASRQRAENYALQLHQFQCHASQVTPRPVIMLTVKRDAESIAQYLHESSVVSIRPRLASQRELQLAGSSSEAGDELLVTLYDITVSATVALNVSLPSSSSGGGGVNELPADQWAHAQRANEPVGINTILSFRPGQRMSFECHLEITGTEFERRERIYINEQEVYQFAEAEEERRRRARLLQVAAANQQADAARDSTNGFFSSFNLVGSSAAAASTLNAGSSHDCCWWWATLAVGHLLALI